ncbi:MAG: membrane protein insertase YidC [bacterium]|nr:membrane protein insertase YidC [bacterium]
MNKNEKLMVFLLGALLVAFLGWRFLSAKSQPQAQPATPTTVEAKATDAKVKDAATAITEAAATTVKDAAATATTAVADAAQAAAAVPAILPEAILDTLANEDLAIEVSTFDASIVKATLKKYPAKNEEGSAPVELALVDTLKMGFAGHMMPRVFTVKEKSDRAITYTAKLAPSEVVLERTITLDETGYGLHVSDKFVNPTANPANVANYVLSAGTMKGAPMDITVGSYDPEEEEVVVRAAQGMGCGCSCTETMDTIPGSNQKWLALCNRYFVTLVAPQDAKKIGFKLVRSEDPKGDASALGVLDYAATTLAANETRETSLSVYIGPKVYDNLVDFGEKNAAAVDAEDMMDFGMFGWFSKLLLKGMNFFYSLIPNYGVAIILLTILVRLIFWPLTRKSTLAMRKMSAIQPEIKEIQQKFKGNPQKIQQETFMLYRKYKVNPLASCLPMLIQIPIFIAFFTMLRSISELRFAGFLWISDLSQPENLFAGVLPIAINILPILTAVTMALQTHMSPGAGDPSQKKMMTWMMPIMMLFFFYNMSSALCLYWTVSQVLSIAQMWWMRRTNDGALEAAPAK